MRVEFHQRKKGVSARDVLSCALRVGLSRELAVTPSPIFGYTGLCIAVPARSRFGSRGSAICESSWIKRATYTQQRVIPQVSGRCQAATVDRLGPTLDQQHEEIEVARN